MPMVLEKIRREKITALIVCPNWATQPYYSALMSSKFHLAFKIINIYLTLLTYLLVVVDMPVPLPRGPNLIQCSKSGAAHPIWTHLDLNAFLVNGNRRSYKVTIPQSEDYQPMR